MDNCMIEECSSTVSARKLCSSHYQSFRSAGTLDDISPSRRHKLSEIDLDTRTAICSLCGIIRAYKKGSRWRCKNTIHRAKKFSDTNTVPNHKLTEAVIRLTQEQNNLCAICGNPEIHNRSLALDHCHITGNIRGLLCHRCNVGLGNFDDTLEGIEKAYNYLRKAEGLDPIM